MAIKIFPIPVGDYQANCYVLSVGDEAVIVDPGDEAAKIFSYIASQALEPVAILMTHGHFDHIGALKEVQKKYNVPVYAHKKEQEYFTNSGFNLSWKVGRTPIEIHDLSDFVFLEEDQILELLDQKIQTLHVPGHSLGSLAYHFIEAQLVVSGDALFKGSVGRTDMIHGNGEQLIDSIKAKLLTLPNETVVYPGHGGATTILDEKRTNPFLQS